MSHRFDPQHVEQCQRYLLDSLTAVEREAFESQWDSSPELLDCLAVQASLLADIGESLSTTMFNDGIHLDSSDRLVDSNRTLSASPTKMDAVSSIFCESDASVNRRLLAGLASLSALVLFVFWVGGLADRSQSQSSAETTASTAAVSVLMAGDAVEIARVWATHRTIGAVDVVDFNIEPLVVDDSIDLFDEPPSWLALGVAQSHDDHASSITQELTDDAT